MLVNMKELLAIAEVNHFAVPAFNISNYAMFNGIMDVSEQKCAPVIIEIHPTSSSTSGPTSSRAWSSVPRLPRCPS